MSAYSTLVLSLSPRGYWRMGEASGNPQDSSGLGHHVNSTNGTPVYSQAGAIAGDGDTAISMPAAAWFEVPDHADLDLGDVFTLEAWIKRISGSGDLPILSKGVGAYLMRLDSTNVLQLLRSGTANIVSSTITITDTTTWHHCVATKNGATVKLYIDGADVTGSVTNSTATDTTTVLSLGGDAPPPSNRSVDALFDELAVYPTALTGPQVATNYSTGVSTRTRPYVDITISN